MARPFLIEAFTDKYPIVRFFAANGLVRPGVPWSLTKPDYLGSTAGRDVFMKDWRTATTMCYADARQQAATLATKLRTLRRDIDLEVGE